jgi:membrane-associated phospholipid phosphatase
MTSRSLPALFGAVLVATFYIPTAAAQSPLSEENRRELERLLAVPAGQTAVSCSDLKPPSTPASTLGRYLLWNEIALDTTAIDHTPNPQDPACFGEQIGPTRASRAMAIIHIAMFDAVNAISKKYVSYSGIPSVSGDVSLDRAIAQAAHDTLVALYSGQQPRLDSIFNIDVMNIHGSKSAIAAGAALGSQAAQAILSLRQNDGSQYPEPQVLPNPTNPTGICTSSDPSSGCVPANTAPGLWEIDPISQLTIALGAHWSLVTPFVLTSASQFRAPTPPALTDNAYRQAWNAVYLIGGDPAHGTSTIRTAKQTFIGKFWAYDGTPNLCAPPRLYNQIVRTIALQQKMLTVPEIARLFALANTAMADAAIAAWESKYFYQYWRPVTGIRNASPPLTADPTWYPLGGQDTNTHGPNFTPPWPSYTSGHATIGGATFEILRQFWPDDTPFTFISDEWNGMNVDPDTMMVRPLEPQTFNSFSEAENQNAQSRIYLGIHWQFDADMGIRQGNTVADYVFGHAFQPVE